MHTEKHKTVNGETGVTNYDGSLQAGVLKRFSTQLQYSVVVGFMLPRGNGVEYMIMMYFTH